MRQAKRKPILSIDIQVHIRGQVHKTSVVRLLKWFALAAFMASRFIDGIHHHSSPFEGYLPLKESVGSAI